MDEVLEEGLEPFLEDVQHRIHVVSEHVTAGDLRDEPQPAGGGGGAGGDDHGDAAAAARSPPPGHHHGPPTPTASPVRGRGGEGALRRVVRVGITHTTRLTYGTHVVEGVMDVRLGPRSDGHQRWQEYDLRATPTAAIRRYYDGFGNAAHLVTIARAHDPSSCLTWRRGDGAG